MAGTGGAREPPNKRWLWLPGTIQSVSQSVFVNGDIYRINKLTTTDKALYRFYVADKSVPPIYLRELS